MPNPVKNFILDTLFPISCLGCGAPDSWFCEKCLAKVKITTRQVCPYCEKVSTDAGKFCPACLVGFRRKNRNPPLDALLVGTEYAAVSSLVHKYKYALAKDLKVVLGKIILESLKQNDGPLPDAIIPVPLHRRRERWRGFNQSFCLAEYLGENLLPNCPLPVLNGFLIRKKYTEPQMKIGNYLARQKNITGAFAITPNSLLLKDKTLLLVDDVATTGATLFECARALKSAGAKRVLAVIIARQEIHRS